MFMLMLLLVSSLFIYLLLSFFLLFFLSSVLSFSLCYFHVNTEYRIVYYVRSSEGGTYRRPRSSDWKCISNSNERSRSSDRRWGSDRGPGAVGTAAIGVVGVIVIVSGARRQGGWEVHPDSGGERQRRQG